MDHVYNLVKVDKISHMHFVLHGVELKTTRRGIDANANTDGTLPADALNKMMQSIQLTARAANVPMEREEIEYTLDYRKDDNVWHATCYL